MNKVTILYNANARYMYTKRIVFPSENYPEYLFKEDMGQETNYVYDMIRNSFKIMGYDLSNYDTAAWNPLGVMIKPGMNVVIKPNMVKDANPINNDLECMLTNPTVVKCIVDYVLIALKGQGRIIIGDAPVQSCNFKKLLAKVGYDKLLNYYKSKDIKVAIDIVDFRDYTSEYVGGILKKYSERHTGIKVELGQNSCFANMQEQQLRDMRITCYPTENLQRYHNAHNHCYMIAPEILNADVIINVPKPKMHRKAGITAALKNMVGITSDKTCLPHHTMGAKGEGGDEYEEKSIIKKCRSLNTDRINDTNIVLKKRVIRIENMAMGIMERLFVHDRYSEGSWFGNNTIWRMIVDLNNIILFADKKGQLTDKVQRKVFTIADMIVVGEKEGPLMPSRKEINMIVMAEDSVNADKVISAIMGYSWEQFLTIKMAAEKLKTGKIDCKILSNINLNTIEDIKAFAITKFGKAIPSSGWLRGLK